MGTMSFSIKLKGWRKEQEFIVYPIRPDDDVKTLKVQSETRMMYVDVATGNYSVTKSHPNGAYFHTYQIEKAHGLLTEGVFEEKSFQELKEKISATSSNKAGNRGVSCDNSGAVNVLL